MLVVGSWLIDHGCVTTCPCCEQRSARADVKRRHRNTQYCKALDDQNYMTSCGGCYADDCEYMADLWSDYYSGRM